MASGISNARRRLAPIPHAVADSKPSRSEERMGHGRLLLWSELPDWQREDNSHIESGYRVATPSVVQCLQSWLYLHNESGSIISALVLVVEC